MPSITQETAEPGVAPLSAATGAVWVQLQSQTRMLAAYPVAWGLMSREAAGRSPEVLGRPAIEAAGKSHVVDLMIDNEQDSSPCPTNNVAHQPGSAAVSLCF